MTIPTERKHPDYGFGIRLRDVTMEAARARVTEALAAEGFGVLTEIDVAATLMKKLGVKIPPYLILGACNPTLAHRAIELEPYIGLLLPCNVTLWQEGDEVAVTMASPDAMFTVTGDERLAPIAAEAERRLRGALGRIVA
jgi:uncharacterized protein (DUF302 family)